MTTGRPMQNFLYLAAPYQCDLEPEGLNGCSGANYAPYQPDLREPTCPCGAAAQGHIPAVAPIRKLIFACNLRPTVSALTHVYHWTRPRVSLLMSSEWMNHCRQFVHVPLSSHFLFRSCKIVVTLLAKETVMICHCLLLLPAKINLYIYATAGMGR